MAFIRMALRWVYRQDMPRLQSVPRLDNRRSKRVTRTRATVHRFIFPRGHPIDDGHDG